MTVTRSAAKARPEASASPGAPAGSKHKMKSPEASEAKRGKKSAGEKNNGHVVEEDGSKQSKQQTTKHEGHPEKAKSGTQKGTAEDTAGRNGATPSNIVEKGIIYFFFRSRVNVGSPSDVSDIARSYIVLRPIAQDAKLGHGPIGDAGNSRLILVPKKTLPQSGRDRWTAFVEKAGASFTDLKEQFLAGAEYTTKTAGQRHTPAASPVGEGIYAITKTGRGSHLAYVLTVPEELGEVQREIGLKEKGSFVVNTKNPEYPSPPNARLPKPPEYPKELLEEFRSLRWVPLLPKHLDFPNTQFIMIGESSGIDKATESQNGEKEGEEEPKEEVEKLEKEDLERMHDLDDSDSVRIYEDLQVHAKDYPKLQTTF